MRQNEKLKKKLQALRKENERLKAELHGNSKNNQYVWVLSRGGSDI
ncbi:MAG: hypothetical protein KAS17_01635 [Victivallaceae bacterium]|nr:hypothetical protein [Victivallaceae bacterium]